MKTKKFSRIPKHIGIIPDGNRRWAVKNKMEKQDGYKFGVSPGVELYKLLIEYGIQEATFYGFTKDNTHRPSLQTKSYTESCIEAIKKISAYDANILVVGKTNSKLFPDELKEYCTERKRNGKQLIDVNFLINYDWQWDITSCLSDSKNNITSIASKNISRIDLIIRWGGRRRLSGFLPIQTVYSDIYVIDEYWPDFKPKHFLDALEWYQSCDVTLGG